MLWFQINYGIKKKKKKKFNVYILTRKHWE